MAKRKRYLNYEYKSNCTHGRMICQICGKKIEHGMSYRWWETSDAYLSEHRSCTEDDPTWKQLDKEEQDVIDWEHSYYKALLEFCNKWGDPDEDDIYLAKQWKLKNGETE